MPRGRAYPAEVRAAAVADIIAGDSIHAVARRHGIPRETVQGWWLEDRPVEPADARTRERMANLIYDCLAEIFSTVRLQLQATASEEWLRNQSAADVGQLLGAELDRALRLLGGFRPVGEQQPGLTDGDEAAG